MKSAVKSTLVILASLLVSALAQAHVEVGTYRGTTTEGATCEMTSEGTYYEGQLKHPLTERVKLVVAGETFIVQHPPVIDETEQMAYFDHDQFKGALPNKTGAKALVVKMQHAPGSEGPSEFYLIDHVYKGDKRTSIKCSGLKFQQ